MNPERLKEGGIQYEEGLHRFSGHVKIYEKYLAMLPELDIYKELKQAMEAGQAAQAFDSCHKLKAFVGNLSIPDLFAQVCESTELLRGTDEISAGAWEKLRRMVLSYEGVAALIRSEM